MVRQSIWSCGVMRPWKEARKTPGGRNQALSFASVIAIALACTTSGFASESDKENNLPPWSIDSNSASMPPYSSSAGAEQHAVAPSDGKNSLQDWRTLLESLLTSPERKELIDNLGSLLQQDDMAGARQLLSSVIEAGTLAIIIIDSIEDPTLRSSLQAMAAEKQRDSTTTPSRTSTAGSPAIEAKIAELESVIERERSRSDAALRDLNAAQEQLSNLKAREHETEELKNAVAREKERTDATLQQVSAMQEQLTALETSLQAKVTETYDLKALLDQERERSASIARELDAAKKQTLSAASIQSEVAELSNALAQEKQRADASAQELQTVRGQLASLTMNKTEAAESKSAWDREKNRADTAILELSGVREQLALLKRSAAEAAELKSALEQEKGKSASLSHEAEVLKEQFATLKAGETRIAALESLAAQEEQRADDALQQVNALQTQLSTLRENEARAQDEFKKEKERAAFAARQLEAAMTEIAALKALATNTNEIESALRREKENAAATLHELHAAKRQIAALESRTEFIPAALPATLIFQTPPALSLPPADKPKNNPGQGIRNDRSSETPPRKPRQASLPPAETKAPVEPAVNEKRTQSRKRNPPAKPDESEASKPVPEIRTQSAAPGRKVSVKSNRASRASVQETYEVPATHAPDLPVILLPDDRFWQVY